MARLTRRGAFLDRDGTLNRRPALHEYVRTVGEFTWLPGAREGVARLARAGYVPIVVSNQQGIARGRVQAKTLDVIEHRINHDLAPYGCSILAFRYCPHDATEDCECRKPKPGLLLKLAADIGIDLAGSWMIGDSESDVAAGLAAGCRTALIGTDPTTTQPDVVAPSLIAVSAIITNNGGPVGERRRVGHRNRT
jgi:D-glycero-D-manno-heptose 1,7-bisphosphate phosphatase